MNNFKTGLLSLLGPLFILASCTNEPDDGGKTPVGDGPSSGAFVVTLVSPSEFDENGHTSVVGTVYNGPSLSPVNFKETAKSGSCRLTEPSTPFCPQACAAGSICVENGKCQVEPMAIGAGKVSITGLTAQSGATSFELTKTNNNYQAGSVSIKYPPCAEGAAVTLTGTGDSTMAAFTVASTGISPLEVLNDSIVLADGKSISLKWKPAADPTKSTISVLVDISHHGGTKGEIECEAPDNGNLEIASTLVDKLKALGISGFPKIEISRRATGTNQDADVKLILESTVNKFLSIPGLVSCSENSHCPTGQTCKFDMKCGT